MDEIVREVLGVVLAGGRSSRMGRNKALLVLEGETLIARVVRLVRQVTREVVVVGDPVLSSYVDAPVVGDETPGLGPLAALRTALRIAYGRDVLLVGCDMPFLVPAALRRVLAEADRWTDAAVVLPRTDNGPQYLHALYRARCLPRVTGLLADGARSLAELVDEVTVVELPPTDLLEADPAGVSTLNVNTPDEYARAIALVTHDSTEREPPTREAIVREPTLRTDADEHTTLPPSLE